MAHAGHHDPKFAPRLPEGLTESMMTYDYYARTRGWAPSVVDGLTLQQLFWLPVIDEARGDASSQLSIED